MLGRLMWRLLREVSPLLLWSLAWNCGWKGMRAVNRFKRAAAAGPGGLFPPFLFVSVTNRCNLRCQGCWVTPSDPATEMSPETLDRVIRECNRQGSYFFGILGGEPLLYPRLFEVIASHRDSYFQIFTNGTRLNADIAQRMRALGNVTPLISIEGLEAVSDERRGGREVFRRATEALAMCRANGLFTGVATSVCKSNLNELVSEAFLDRLVAAGAHYMWYYIYRPAGPNPCPELALSEEEITRLRQFVVDMRAVKPLILVDAYWDDRGQALCPAATGISHHINPAGDVEPCPPIQFAADNIGDARNLAAVLQNSQFLTHFRTFSRSSSRGCILLENPHALFDFLAAEKARDTTGRGTGFEELAAMKTLPGHYQPGHEIPEKHWVYRFAKKHWFFGFGAYG